MHHIRKTVILIYFVIPLLLIGCSAKEPLPPNMYLSDLEWESATTGEGEAPDKDKNQQGETLTLVNNRRNSVEFEKGIGTKAESEIIYDLSKMDYNYFTAWVGADNKLAERKSSVQFEIYVDDELRYQSRNMGFTTPMEYVHVNIRDAEKLKLVVKDGPLKSDANFAIWADAQLHMENPIIRNVEEIKEYDGMVLIFNEEFDSDEIDTEKWQLRNHPENGTHHYANVVGEGENIWVKDGNLHIQAKKYEGDGNYSTTSAAISTENKFYFRYGRVDVRAKLPTEAGMWPAIWMMPEKPDYGWPMAGEIDIMELISQEPDKIWSTIHSGIYDRKSYYFNSGSTLTIDQGTFFDDYHVFSMEWEPNRMAFYVDDELVVEITEWKNYVLKAAQPVEREYPLPFNRYFYLIINLATGGWSQDINDSTRFGERTTMLVDYVRVYQKEHKVDNISDLIDLVNYFDSAGDFTEEAKTALLTHLDEMKALEEHEKMIEKLTAFKELIEELNNEEQILFVDAYEGLLEGADELISKLK